MGLGVDGLLADSGLAVGGDAPTYCDQSQTGCIYKAAAATGCVVADRTRRVALAALVGLFVVVFVGQLVGQPVGIAYVDSGSMEPTMTAGDAFIAVPSILTPAPEVGEIITYDAETMNGGGLTTHRVHDKVETGYITKGDANLFTDQGAGEPPVTADQIVAEPLQIGPLVVVIPYLGTVIGMLQGAIVGVISGVAGVFGIAGIDPARVRFGLFAAGLALLVWSVVER